MQRRKFIPENENEISIQIIFTLFPKSTETGHAHS